MFDAGKGGSERPPRVVCRDVRRQEAPTVIGLPQRDDLTPPGVQKSHVDGRLDRLGPRVREERLAQLSRSDLRQAPGRFDLGFGDVERGRMAQPTDLSLDSPNDLGMAVAHGRREDSAEEVQVLPSIDVAYTDPFTFM